MATATTTAPPPRTLPADVFAALTPPEYLKAVLTQAESSNALRANGRRTNQFRAPTFNTNSLVHCNGSAVIRSGGTSTVCGVRAELLLAKNIPSLPIVDLEKEHIGAEERELANLNLLVPNIELSTGCNSNHIPGNPPTALAQSLSHRLSTLLHLTHLVRASDLRITESRPEKTSAPDSISLDIDDEDDSEGPIVHAYWTLYIDIVFISLDGNAFDAAWQALLTALRNTRLPRAWYDRELESVICSPEIKESRLLSLRGCPIASTFAVFEPSKLKGTKPDEEHTSWILGDPDQLEESICTESLTIVVDREERGENIKVKRIEKNGGMAVSGAQIGELVSIAERRHTEYLASIED